MIKFGAGIALGGILGAAFIIGQILTEKMIVSHNMDGSVSIHHAKNNSSFTAKDES